MYRCGVSNMLLHLKYCFQNICVIDVYKRQVLDTLNNKYTYIECKLETGRTHQIRVHMASIGHPILGDTVYGLSLIHIFCPHFINERLFYHKKVLNNTMNKLIVLPIIFLWLNCY